MDDFEEEINSRLAIIAGDLRDKRRMSPINSPIREKYEIVINYIELARAAMKSKIWEPEEKDS